VDSETPKTYYSEKLPIPDQQEKSPSIPVAAAAVVFNLFVISTIPTIWRSSGLDIGLQFSDRRFTK